MKYLLKPILIFFLTLTVFIIALQITNYNKIILGLKISGLNIGGDKIVQNNAELSEYLANLEKREINLIYQGKQYRATLNELGATFNKNEALNVALAIGRKKNFFKGLAEQTAALLGAYNLESDVTIDEDKLNKFIKSNLNDVITFPENAYLIFNKEKNNFDLIPAKNGIIIDKNKFKNDLKKIWKASSISLSLITAIPEIQNNETTIAQKKAETILENVPYSLKYNQNIWFIDKSALLNWLIFLPTKQENKNIILDVSLDKEKIKEYLSSEISPIVNSQAVNAQLTIKNDRATIFSLPKNGILLNEEKNINNIVEKILKTNQSEIELIAEITAPKIKNNEDINNLGLTSLLAMGESDFKGSPKNRIHNIKNGLSKINGVILKPAEEFSFINAIGEIEAETGYLPELVIKNKKTIPEYGGGVCQISTTVFRAAVNGGLKITERYAHAFPVKYYNPQGFDATIYPPRPDLKFINNTPNHILIQGRIEGTKLIFEIYGTDDKREIKIKGPNYYDQKPDGSLKAILYQEIWRDGQLKETNTFRSNYKSPDLYPIERNPLE